MAWPKDREELMQLRRHTFKAQVGHDNGSGNNWSESEITVEKNDQGDWIFVDLKTIFLDKDGEDDGWDLLFPNELILNKELWDRVHYTIQGFQQGLEIRIAEKL